MTCPAIPPSTPGRASSKRGHGHHGPGPYEFQAGFFPTATGHLWASMYNATRKVVFSRMLKTADWANTTTATGDLAEEVGKLRRGGDGYILAGGGISFWQSLARLDLIDEYRVTLVPYLAAADGTRLFGDAGKSRQLDLVSSTAFCMA